MGLSLLTNVPSQYLKADTEINELERSPLHVLVGFEMKTPFLYVDDPEEERAGLGPLAPDFSIHVIDGRSVGTVTTPNGISRIRLLRCILRGFQVTFPKTHNDPIRYERKGSRTKKEPRRA